MDKTITVKVEASTFKEDFKELEFPQVKKYLDEEYHIVGIHQVVFGANNYCSCITFHLRK